MPDFSANIGFLWPGLSDPDRIRAAGAAGFDAVECHFPYEYPTDDMNDALAETGLSMLGINTALGKNGPDDFGVTAQSGREEEAISLIDQAIDYAVAIKCRSIHVLAGKTGRRGDSEETYRKNLAYACEKAKASGKQILIEPINQRNAPGYHLSSLQDAISTIDAVGADNLKMMFDCYHVQIMQGDIVEHLKSVLPYVGHIQFAAVPDRGEPDDGEINYPFVFRVIDELGWSSPIGAEYIPRASMDEGLGWLEAYRSSS